MRFTEIGQQLRAYRLESGLRAEEIAARLGVSRAALYRYEKGEVIKLDTIKRLAELLKISPLSLLGIGVEYYHRPVGYFERIRQIEETADQILQITGPLCQLTTSDQFDSAMAAIYTDLADQAGADRAAMRNTAEQLLGILAARKRMYATRRQGIIAIFSMPALRSLLAQGLAGSLPVSDRVRAIARNAARIEVEAMVTAMEIEPMGLQFGVLRQAEASGRFVILRSRDRANLGVNPFAVDGHPTIPLGVAMITGADEAISAHQRAAEAAWREAVKGPAAATLVRELLVETAVHEPA